MKKRLIFLVGIIIFTLFSLTPISGQTILEEKRVPVTETLDLLLDGTTPILVNITTDIDFIIRIVFELVYNDSNWIGSEFAKAGPLTNGLCIIADGSSLLDFNITSNNRFNRLAFDTTFFKDDQTPNGTHIYSKFSFEEISPPDGLRYSSNNSLQFMIQDNMTTTALDIEAFNVEVEGFRIELVVTENSDESEFFLIHVINWWGLFLYQNIFVLLAVMAVTIILIKILI